MTYKAQNYSEGKLPSREIFSEGHSLLRPTKGVLREDDGCNCYSDTPVEIKFPVSTAN